MNRFFCWQLSFASLACITAPIPLGLLLIRFLWTCWHKLSIESPPASIAHALKQEGPIYVEVLPGVLYKAFNRWHSVAVQNT